MVDLEIVPSAGECAPLMGYTAALVTPTSPAYAVNGISTSLMLPLASSPFGVHTELFAVQLLQLCRVRHLQDKPQQEVAVGSVEA